MTHKIIERELRCCNVVPSHLKIQTIVEDDLDMKMNVVCKPEIRAEYLPWNSAFLL